MSLKKIAVIDPYARVSRASDKRDLSTNGQVIECKEIVVDRGYQVGETHVDSSKSAWNVKVFRAGWHNLMTRLETGAADGVIVFELSRFARRAEDGLRLLRLAQKGIIVIDSEGEYDLTQPKQAKNFRDAISQAEFESDMTSRRTRRGKRHKAIERKEPNSSSRAFGFELGNIIAREGEAAVLRECAARLLAGEDQGSVCRDLNARGDLTVHGNPWKPPSLRVALLRPANVGDVVHNGVIVHKGAHPGILDRDTYEQVAALYAGRRRGRPTTNLCTGFLRCVCGNALHCKPLSSANRYTPYPDGTTMKSYLCVKRAGVGCGNSIDWRDLDDFVKDTALTILSDPAHAEAIEAAAERSDSAHAALDQVTAKIEELNDIVASLDERLGEMGLARYDRAVKPIEEQLAKLHGKKNELVASMPQRVERVRLESRATLERRWKAADISGRREMVAKAFRGRKLQVSAGPRLSPAEGRCSFVQPGVERAGGRDL
jgi:site-specific DNA recombinase